MQIEAGKSYRATNGERVGPMIDFDSPFHPRSFIREIGDGFVWDGAGRCTSLDDEKDQWHLVAEWTDGPVRTETVTKRHIVPGVYDTLQVWREINVPDCGKPDAMVQREVKVCFVGTTIDQDGIETRSLSAPQLRELARVALELAEYLESEQ